MIGINPNPERPWWIDEVCCYQCDEYSPRGPDRFVCPHCGFTPTQPRDPAPQPPKPTAAATPETDDAVAILVALGIRASDARTLVASAAKAGTRGAESIVAWRCRARFSEGPGAERKRCVLQVG